MTRGDRGRGIALLSAAAGSLCGAFAVAALAAGAQTIEWQQLEPGLELASVRAPRIAKDGDSLVRVLRVDPRHFDLEVLSASATDDGKPRTAKAWARLAGIVAVTNAGMYQADHRTAVSLLQSRDHVNNSRLSKDKAVLAFDRLDSGVPRAQIIDRSCQDFTGLRKRYAGFLQSIRMISCDRRNVWGEQPRRWSTAALGADGSGRILLIHVRTPYATHELIDNLLQLPLDLRRAMYLEGGAQAQLYVDAGGRDVEVVGSRGSSGIGGNLLALPIPNALVVRRRTAAAATK